MIEVSDLDQSYIDFNIANGKDPKVIIVSRNGFDSISLSIYRKVANSIPINTYRGIEILRSDDLKDNEIRMY